MTISSGLSNLLRADEQSPALRSFYDNAASGLSSVNVQAAIDELANMLGAENLTFVGTYDASTNQIDYLTAAGTSAGLTVGADIPAADPAYAGMYFFVSVGGAYPSGGDTANQGDQILCDGATWILLTFGSVVYAGSVVYDPTTSGMAATDVQAAINELDARLDVVESGTYVNSFTGAQGTVHTGTYSAIYGDYDADLVNATDTAGRVAGAPGDPVDVQTYLDSLDDKVYLLETSPTGVTSFNARTGVVVPAPNTSYPDVWDYNSAQIQHVRGAPDNYATVEDALDSLRGDVDIIEGAYIRSWNGETVIGGLDYVPQDGDYAANQVTYDNALSGLLAVQVQAAIDELSGALEVIGASYVTSFNTRTGAIFPASGDYDASIISYDNDDGTGSPNIPSLPLVTTVQDAIQTAVDDIQALTPGGQLVNSWNGRIGSVTPLAPARGESDPTLYDYALTQVLYDDAAALLNGGIDTDAQTAIELLAAKISVLQGNLQFAGLYDGQLQMYVTRSAEAEAAGFAAFPAAIPPASVANTRFYFIVSVEGIYDGADVVIGDWIVSDGTSWYVLEYSNRSVTASEVIYNNLASGLVATDAQSAIDELAAQTTGNWEDLDDSVADTYETGQVIMRVGSSFTNTLPEFRDSQFKIYGTPSSGQQLAFDVAPITSLTVRTATAPDYDLILGAFPVFRADRNYLAQSVVEHDDGAGRALWRFSSDHLAGAWVGTDVYKIVSFSAAMIISDTAPSVPSVGQLWMDSSTADMKTYVWYDDGESQQWILQSEPNDTIPNASETEVGIAEIATQAEVDAGTDDLRIVTPLKLKTYVDAEVAAVPATPNASETVAGKAEIATQTEVNTGTDNARFVTPQKLKTYVDAEIAAIPATPNASETVKGIAEIATQAEVNTGTDNARFVTPLKLKTYVDAEIAAIPATPNASETVKGIAEIATQAEVDAGADNTRFVTPMRLKTYVDDEIAAIPATPSASESVKGIAEIATQTEVNTGTDNTRFVTPQKLKTYVDAEIADIPATPSASETVKGIAEIATQAEVDAGTDNARFVTPQKLKTLLDGRGVTYTILWTGSLSSGDFTLSQSYKNFDAIITVGSDDDGNRFYATTLFNDSLDYMNDTLIGTSTTKRFTIANNQNDYYNGKFTSATEFEDRAENATLRRVYGVNFK